jgi:hypothetical protein
MAELKLISDRKRQLKPLVEAALKTEMRLLEAGIKRTKNNMREFEERFHLSSHEFISRHEKDEMKESLDYADWIGEHRMLEHLKEKVDNLRTIRFSN